MSRWSWCAIVRPHAEAVLSRADTLHADTIETARLRFALAYYLDDRAEYAAARTLLEQALATCRRVLGDDHPDTLTSMNNLAEVLHAQGDLPAAHTLLEQALATRRRVLGDDHPHTLTSMNNLAEVLHAQGDLPAAHTLLKQTLTTRRQVLNDHHPDTLTSMNNLADVLADLGDEDTATDLRRRVSEAQAAAFVTDQEWLVRLVANAANGDADSCDQLTAHLAELRQRDGWTDAFPELVEKIVTEPGKRHPLDGLDDLERALTQAIYTQLGDTEPEAGIGGL